MKILRDILTGSDNQTHDIGRWSWLLSILSIVGGGAFNALHAGVVDLMSFAQALGVVVGAHGASLWAKRDTEPASKSEPK
jgi:hypothetical protein